VGGGLADGNVDGDAADGVLTGRPKTIQEHIARHNAERNTLFVKNL
jgi:hypothetical protein